MPLQMLTMVCFSTIKGTRQQFATEFLTLSVRRASEFTPLSQCRDKSELPQQGHRIIIAAVSDNPPIPDLYDVTEP